MLRYYDSEGNINREAFNQRLEELHNEVEDKDLTGLVKIRNKLYALKRKHEESGRRFLDCEFEIEALNELIAESRE